MLYLLDASALITAHQTWYSLGRVPEFWAWLRHHGAAGTIKMPEEIYEEVEQGTDDLSTWIKDAASKTALLLSEASVYENVLHVLSCYGENLSEGDLEIIGKDPFLVAAAFGASQRCVVSSEISKPNKIGANRRVPDICKDCNVTCISPIRLLAVLNFTTNWDA